jgi:ABC-type polar amino acid transport system ATPase subunit
MPDPLAEPILKLQGLQKNYGGLRPLRIQELEICAGERVSLIGLDPAAAEVFVNLATGAVLPDQGEVFTFGQNSKSITDGAQWLAILDQLGLVSDRIVLLEALSVAQNLAVPFTLDIDPIDEDVMRRVYQLARELKLEEKALARPSGLVSPLTRARMRLGRTLALNPRALILEHPTATLDSTAVGDYVQDIVRVADARRLSIIALTADKIFAGALGGRVLVQHPATGALERQSRWPWWR